MPYMVYEYFLALKFSFNFITLWQQYTMIFHIQVDNIYIDHIVFGEIYTFSP